MSIKTWKNKELTTLLSEAWGFGFNLDNLNENVEEGLEEASPSYGRPKPHKRTPVPDDDDDEDKDDRKRSARVTTGTDDPMEEGDKLEEMCPDEPQEVEMGVEMSGVEMPGDEGPEDTEGLAAELLAVAQKLADALGVSSDVTEPPVPGEEESMEEGGLANRKGDPRQRRPEASPIREDEETDKLEEQVRKVVRMALRKIHKENKK